MKLLSLFSGIGAFEKALDRKNINYNLVPVYPWENIDEELDELNNS